MHLVLFFFKVLILFYISAIKKEYFSNFFMASSKNSVLGIMQNKSTFRMGLFATSKLIQNLGKNREQFEFIGYFRTIHGRD